ncbi:hypothetical protein Scep_012844 [Stephania cephalantha]|uniref:OTU domain-containing protein n=1 Tax=Stephania cephalantha TaxID=152367 RepID=A0AAP0PA82_9MAGN
MHMRIVQQLREISYPSSVSLIVPRVKVKTRGKPSQLGKERKRKVSKVELDVENGDTSTKRNPSHFEHVLHPEMIPKKITHLVPHMVHRTRTLMHAVCRDRYSGAAPEEWLDHIEKVDDVKGDGNCGYRVIAAGLGHHEDDAWKRIQNYLYWELQGHQNIWRPILGGDHFETILLSVQHYHDSNDAPLDKWMCMPDLGLVIATCYNVILVSLSPLGSMTFFPLRGAPLVSLSDRVVIGMTHVNNNHFMQVLFKADAHFPQLYPGWRNNIQPEALPWCANLNWKLPATPSISGTPTTVHLDTP